MILRGVARCDSSRPGPEPTRAPRTRTAGDRGRDCRCAGFEGSFVDCAGLCRAGRFPAPHRRLCGSAGSARRSTGASRARRGQKNPGRKPSSLSGQFTRPEGSGTEAQQYFMRSLNQFADLGDMKGVADTVGHQGLIHMSGSQRFAKEAFEYASANMPGDRRPGRGGYECGASWRDRVAFKTR